jgi:membrane associated rhomboid family serine protease
MPPQEPSLRAMGLIKPGRALTSVMVTLGAIWLMFALAVNWGGAPKELFDLFCGNTQLILHGEVWRLLTAPLMHARDTVSHILFAILGLFFLAPSLEQRWGGARMIRFLIFSAVIAYGFQMLLEVVLPDSLSHKLVGPYWFGAFPVLEAVAIAWALSFRGQTVRLWFVLPVTSTGMVVFIMAMSLLRVVAMEVPAEGLLSPFGGMLAGWLLGGTPSPLRRAYLKLRLAQLDREAARGARAAADRRKSSPLRVIEGGRGQAPPNGEEGGPGGRMLH